MPAAPVIDRVLDQGEVIITYAVPFFFLMVLIEMIFILAAGKDYLRLNDSITDLSCGIIEQVLGVFLRTAVYGLYTLVFLHARLFEIRELPLAAKALAVFGLFLGVDMLFYWFHRWAHVWAAPWATHVVHHSSEEMNLIVALRQSAFEDLFAAVFYLPLALAGFPPEWFAAMFSFNLIWQFWCHTRLIGKLGPLEWVFNTPSHHRVHHARNPKYLDKNYAGTLIVWDRMFGTYMEEDEEPVYGITKPLASWNPWWANLHYWFELADLARRAPYAWDKFKVWFMPLGWTPRGLAPQRFACEVTHETVIKYNARAPLGLNLYVLLQFGLTLALSLLVTTQADEGAALATLALPAVAVFIGLLNFGALFERRRWGLPAELLRLTAVAAGTIYYLRSTSYAQTGQIAVIALAAASVVWLALCHRSLVNPAFVQVAKAGLKPAGGDGESSASPSPPLAQVSA